MTEFIDSTVRWGGALVCLLVLAGCIDRIRVMSWATHRVSVWALYLCGSAYAGGVLTDLFLDHHVDWYEAAGVAGYLFHLVHTRHEWRHDKAPTDSERVPLGDK